MNKKLKPFLLIFRFGMICLFLLNGCSPLAFYENSPIIPTSNTTMKTVLPSELTMPVVDNSLEPVILSTSSFSKEAVTKISQGEVTNDIFQEIVKFMVTKWLQGFQIETTAKDAIKDYKIDKIFLRNQPSDINSEIIATVLFSVQVINPQSNNWASVSVQEINQNDLWWQVALTFDIFPLNNNYVLKVLYGYGT